MAQGKCYICGGMYSDRGMAKHLKTCLAERHGAVPSAEDVPEDGMYLLKVQDRYFKEYYLYLLADSCVLLSELDQYLRDIWLECCGHLSSFRIDGESYESYPDSSWRRQKGMCVEIGEVLDMGMKFSYTYDFGSSTDLELKVMDIYEPFHEDKGIRLAARNMTTDPGSVNSPRAGVCGYDGPADDILFMKHGKAKNRKKNKGRNPAGQDRGESFLDRLEGGRIGEEDIEEFLLGMMRMVGSNSYAYPPFIIGKDKLKGEKLRDYLNQLRKNELDSVRKYHNIENVSGLKKDALAAFLNDYLISRLEDVLAYMPAPEYSALIGLSAKDNVLCDASEEIPGEFDDLRSMGLVFTVYDRNGGNEWVIPREIRTKIKGYASNREFLKKRELSTQIEQTMLCIFFYWGVVRRHDLFNETAKLLGMQLDDALAGHIGKVFGYMTASYIESERIGSGEYFYMFSEEPAQQVISDSWQKARYPEITREMVTPAGAGWIGLVLQNPHFRWMYDTMLEIEESEPGEELNRDTMLDTISSLAEYIFNARPGTTIEQIGKKFELEEAFKYDSNIRELFKNMLMHSPNYWMKGNAVSGTVHVISSRNNRNNGLKNAGKKAGQAPGKAAEKAAAKWKVGRNDPCPCGSGKKFKKCCM